MQEINLNFIIDNVEENENGGLTFEDITTEGVFFLDIEGEISEEVVLELKDELREEVKSEVRQELEEEYENKLARHKKIVRREIREELEQEYSSSADEDLDINEKGPSVYEAVLGSENSKEAIADYVEIQQGLKNSNLNPVDSSAIAGWKVDRSDKHPRLKVMFTSQPKVYSYSVTEFELAQLQEKIEEYDSIGKAFNKVVLKNDVS